MPDRDRLCALRAFESTHNVKMDLFLFRNSQFDDGLVPIGSDEFRENPRQMADCATAGCHAGWSNVLAALWGQPIPPGNMWHSAAVWLDLGKSEARFLFNGSTHLYGEVDTCDEQEAAARLDYLIEYDSAPEYHFTKFLDDNKNATNCDYWYRTWYQEWRVGNGLARNIEPSKPSYVEVQS